MFAGCTQAAVVVGLAASPSPSPRMGPPATSRTHAAGTYPHCPFMLHTQRHVHPSDLSRASSWLPASTLSWLNVGVPSKLAIATASLTRVRHSCRAIWVKHDEKQRVSPPESLNPQSGWGGGVGDRGATGAAPRPMCEDVGTNLVMFAIF